MTEEQKELLRGRNIRLDDKEVIYEDKYTLEVISRRGRRFVIKKKRRRRKNESKRH